MSLSSAPSEFTLFIRHPKWNDKAPLKVKVNGRRVRGNSAPGEYFAITRTWKDGDRVEVKFDMYTYGEYFPDNSPYMALLHGPVVLAAATGTKIWMASLPTTAAWGMWHMAL
jgi:uncharacterized protein